MKDSRCEDNASLIGFLYEDCEADERARIAAHVAICPLCAGELAALSATRDHLSAWTPPDVQLAFRMSQAGAAPAVRWWSRPMPAWAQLAAAVVIFAGGALIGNLSARAAASTTAVAMSSSVQDATNREETLRIERRLSALERQSMNHPQTVSLDDSSSEAILTRVDHQIRQSENRQRVELATFGMNILKDSSEQAREQLQRDREERSQEDNLRSQTVQTLWTALNAKNTD
jgi:hypothetical protein